MIGSTKAILFARSMCSSMRCNSATSGSMASIRQRADRSLADDRPGRQRRLSLAGDPMLPLQDAERRRPRGDEAPTDHFRARPRRPTALPEMRKGGAASRTHQRIGYSTPDRRSPISKKEMSFPSAPGGVIAAGVPARIWRETLDIRAA
jgi:hypothetical protein